VGVPVDEADARCAAALGDHSEAASAGAEEVDVQGVQCFSHSKGVKYLIVIWYQKLCSGPVA
jgi:hypothetical protein